jgi:hypothetical protein
MNLPLLASTPNASTWCTTGSTLRTTPSVGWRSGHGPDSPSASRQRRSSCSTTDAST